ncbi:multiple sugar transport system substrate-binding protein [Lentzea xinjiangensis]|uniref:Multiple sugar transport system substrate-binding protein n=1 Tax=Lentzea xinjiangensis TaxID=402600 RepID=A0A1H9WQB5_9PSEU|nr:multiple sugar transport system substrate-binding protein [Lentzea xinjiangensis]
MGRYQDKVYSFGFYDVALTMFSRKSVLEKNGIRIPTPEQPWTRAEFSAALAKLKATGEFEHPLEMGTGGSGEWWPYAYSPRGQLLHSARRRADRHGFRMRFARRTSSRFSSTSRV